MSSNNSKRSRNAASSAENVPYTITEQDGKMNIVFTSGPQQGDNFEISRPHAIGIGEGSRTEQLEAEPPHPVSYLDGNGDEISEEFERLPAAEIADEGSREEGGGMGQVERRT